MADKKINWTPQQLRAITGRGSDIIVTASAGTGKTAVLSGRCVDIVSDRTVGDVSSILVLTFTEAAAEQMRQRISQQLRQAYFQSRQKHLLTQLVMLQGADISTIHSFCKRLITEHFYTLGLDPTFRIIEDDEQKLIKAEVLEQTIDWAWQQEDLQQPLQQLLQGRDLRANEGFLSEVANACEFLTNVVDRENWYTKAVSIAEHINPLHSGPGQKQKQFIAERLHEICEQIDYLGRVYQRSGGSDGWADKWSEYIAKPARQAIEYIESQNWEQAVNIIRSFDLGRKQYKPRGLDDDGLAVMLGDGIKTAKAELEELKNLAVVNPDYSDTVAESVAQQTAAFVELVRCFERLYSQRKRKLNYLDFSDLEHYTLKLLSATDQQGGAVASATAMELRKRYKYIFVDEYQDINPVQQAILENLATPGCVFRVGDVKQSIYAFRGAEPRIFLNDITRAATDETESPLAGLRVDLQTNWRSRKEILDFVNHIFGRIMRAGFADIDYDDSAKLKSPEDASQGSQKSVEFHLLDEDAPNDDADTENNFEQNDSGTSEAPLPDTVTARQRQAALVAMRIQEMVRQARVMVPDKAAGTKRPVEYRDIVILFRSPATVINDYVEVLRQAGVPVSGQACAGYFQAAEVVDCICLLKVLDNPRQDIELASIMRSPFFSFSDSDLAGIRLLKGKSGGDFYELVKNYAQCGPDADLADRLRQMLQRLSRWRTMARRGRLADLIWRIFRETGYIGYVCALPSGQGRKANLLMLHERAIQFESFVSSQGTASLRRFVEFLTRLDELGRDWSPAEPENTLENAVRILSIHKSKGLEFPIVILGEINAKFNLRDTYGCCLLDAEHTVGLDVADSTGRVRLASLVHQVVSHEKRKASLAEELRVMYVAMTRAKEHLIITASGKASSAAKIAKEGFYFGREPVAHWRLRRCRCLLDWVLLGLSNQRQLHEALGTSVAAKTEQSELCDVIVHDSQAIAMLNEYVQQIRTASAKRVTSKHGGPVRADKDLLCRVKRSMSIDYPLCASAYLPAKQSVTNAVQSSDEFAMYDYSRTLQRIPRAIAMRKEKGSDQVDARLTGTAVHLVISELDLSDTVTLPDIERTKQRLVENGSILPEVAECVDVESIARFFNSELGRAVLSSQRIHREWPFTLAVKARQWQRIIAANAGEGLSVSGRVGDSDFVIVQGIMDLLAQDDDEIFIVDFKNDDITPGQVSERAELYRMQVELYGQAAGQICKAKKLSKWLYFLKPAEAVEIK